MTVAASYDPLYPLKAAVHVAPEVFELVEIDIYQFVLCHDGKTAVFRHLQNRMIKAIKFDSFAYILIFGVIIILTALELSVRIADWLRRRREATRENAATAAETNGLQPEQHQQSQQQSGPNAPGISSGTANGNTRRQQTSSTQQS